MAYKAVLFDVDGTIVMSEDRNRDVIATLAAAHGALVKPEYWAHLAGQPEKDIWMWLKERCDRFAIGQDEFVTQCRAAYLKSDFNVIARPGIKYAINYFHLKGLFEAAVSNSPRHIIEHGLKTVGCYEDMAFIISAVEDVANPKPYPDSYLLAIKRVRQNIPDLRPSEVLIFEDSGTGVAAGYAAGARVIHIADEGTPDHEGAHHHVHNEQELIALCHRLVP